MDIFSYDDSNYSGGFREEPGGPSSSPPPHPPHSYFLDQAEAPRAEKVFLETAPPPAPSYLKVWIGH